MKETKTILVMDDEPEYVEMVKQFLEEDGYHVVTAGDGESGLKVIHSLCPDLVIMDVNMPHMNGLQFYREISTAHGRSKVPVLVITARGELEPLFRELEVEGFLTKPFQVATLLSEIEVILNGKKEKTVFLVDLKDLPSTLAIAETLRRERYRVVFAEDPAAVGREVAAGNWPDFVAMEYARKEKENRSFILEIKKYFPQRSPKGRLPLRFRSSFTLIRARIIGKRALRTERINTSDGPETMMPLSSRSRKLRSKKKRNATNQAAT